MIDRSFESLNSVLPGVSRETYYGLKHLEQTLAKWNRSINLVAPSTVPDAWTRHILDSAQLLGISQDAKQWMDIGSGGGFPGLVLGVGLRDRSGARIDLVESNRKKAGFLQMMVGQLDLPARVHATRIEAVVNTDVQIITARALAPLPDLLRLSSGWLSNGARGLFHKGRDYGREIVESAHSWSFDLIEHPSAVDPDGVILDISKLRKRTG